MLKSLFINYNIVNVLVKLSFSMFVSGLMIMLSIISANNYVTLFISFTILNYISVEAVLMVFTTSVTSFYDKVTSELYKIQQDYISKIELSDNKKEILKYKFIRVREDFVKGVLTQQFLRTNRYNSELEIESLRAIAAQTTEMYIDDMIKAGVTQEFIDCFNKIHSPATMIFMNKVSESISSENLIWERRRVFYIELTELMKSSVSHFLEANIKNGCNDINKIESLTEEKE